ncbi:MAG TPA: FkbM family methyltransferase [Rhodopila sp.]
MEPTADAALFRKVDTRYGRLMVFANDTGAVTQSLLHYGEWAENELRFLHSFIDEGAVVLDVGAYIGTHTLAFSRFVGSAGRVVAIEAQIPTFKVLQSNVAANGIGNVTLENAVMSCEAGSVAIHSIQIDRQQSFGSASLLQTLFPGDAGSANETEPPDVDVRAITIDSLDLARCALIKIDAEGMEEPVLRGAQRTLTRCAPVIYAECNSIHSGLPTVRALKAAGYRVMAHVVRAFNQGNFNASAENIFGPAREAALVGIKGDALDRLERIRLEPGELLLDIETADDLALALLNKPQYVPEVLRPSAAARSGGLLCIEEADASRSAAERLQHEAGASRGLAERLQHEADASRVLAERLQHDADASRAVAERLASEAMASRIEAERLGNDANTSRLEVERLRQETESRRVEADRLGSEIAALHDALAQQQRESQRQILLERENTTAARAELERVRQNLEATLDACIRQSGLIRKEADRVKAINVRLQAEAAAATAALTAVHRSTSWRLTAPLRTLTERARGNRR